MIRRIPCCCFAIIASMVGMVGYAESTLLLNGNCYDLASGKNIPVRVSVVNNGMKSESGTGDATGFKKIPVPLSAQFLVFESEGYRSFRVPVYVREVRPGSSFFVRIPMVPVDRQQQNRAYQQTEQQHYVQDSGAQSAGTKKAIFEIRDALTSAPVEAKICLTFTKSGRTKCFDVDPKSTNPSIMLTQKDIVAFEITAKNYQTYQGNLIIETLDGKEETHTIGLLGSLNLLSVQVDADDPSLPYKLALQSQRSQSVSAFRRHGTTGLWYAPDAAPGVYRLVAASQKDGEQLYESDFSIQEGITLASIQLRQSPGPVAVTAFPQDYQVSRPVVIPFAQSSYNLSSQTIKKIDSVAGFLTKHRHYKVRLTGYTDNIGKKELNLILSEYRARVVAARLRNKGVSDRQIRFAAKGGEDPVAPNDTEENRSRNRRVLIQIGRNDEL